jgi:hypothetical protein
MQSCRNLNQAAKHWPEVANLSKMTQLILRNWANIEDRQAMVEELSEN